MSTCISLFSTGYISLCVSESLQTPELLLSRGHCCFEEWYDSCPHLMRSWRSPQLWWQGAERRLCTHLMLCSEAIPLNTQRHQNVRLSAIALPPYTGESWVITCLSTWNLIGSNGGISLSSQVLNKINSSCSLHSHLYPAPFIRQVPQHRGKFHLKRVLNMTATLKPKFLL